MRSQGEGKGIQLEAPLRMTLERAIEYIDIDEYVEATPKSLRLRKRILDVERAAAPLQVERVAGVQRGLRFHQVAGEQDARIGDDDGDVAIRVGARRCGNRPPSIRWRS